VASLFTAMLQKITTLVEGMKQEVASNEAAILTLEAQLKARREAVAKDKRKLRDLEITQKNLQHLDEDTHIPEEEKRNLITKEDLQKLLDDHQPPIQTAPWTIPWYPQQPHYERLITPQVNPNEPYITWGGTTTVVSTPNVCNPTLTVGGLYTREDVGHGG
jgi:hypothetical protein